MNSGRTIFAQVMDFLPLSEFHRCVERYRGDYKVQSFSCWDQFLCLAFAQLTGRESLRDIEACLRSQQPKLYHMGFRGRISRNTLAHANETRDWRIFADFVGVRQGVARDAAAKTHVIQLRLLRAQTGFDVAQTFAPGELRESQAEKLIPAGETLDLVIASIALDTPAKLRQREKIHHLRKDSPTRVHVPSLSDLWNGDSLSVISNRFRSLLPSNPSLASAYRNSSIQRWDSIDLKHQISNLQFEISNFKT